MTASQQIRTESHISLVVRYYNVRNMFAGCQRPVTSLADASRQQDVSTAAPLREPFGPAHLRGRPSLRGTDFVKYPATFLEKRTTTPNFVYSG